MTMMVCAYNKRHMLTLLFLAIATYKLQRTNNVLFLDDEERPTASSSATNGTVGERYAYNYTARKYQDQGRWMDRYPFLPKVEDVSDEQRICFVHVGKTAGSTMACYLGFQYSACRDRMRVLPGHLPQYTTNLIHTHYE